MIMQLKMIHMMGRGNVKHSGQFSVYVIKEAATYMIFTTEILQKEGDIKGAV
jgi:hypothetical protein